jgi:hypothetical protein
MKTRRAPPDNIANGEVDCADAAKLAALRAWYEGMSAREAVVRFLAAESPGRVIARYSGAH